MPYSSQVSKDSSKELSRQAKSTRKLFREEDVVQKGNNQKMRVYRMV